MNKVKIDKKREAEAGHDGTWIAHPGLAGIALDAFGKVMQEANQIDKENIKEIILALSSTVEGDATAIFIKDHVDNIKVSRISYGIPIGWELEYVDSNTIARSIIGRVEINDD